MMIENIISGGQTGVDRVALDVALKQGIPHGGWTPKGCMLEDGPIDYAKTEAKQMNQSSKDSLNTVDAVIEDIITGSP